MAVMTDSTPEKVAADFAGQGYGTFKSVVADAVVEGIRPIRGEYDKIIKDKAYLQGIYESGAETAHRIADRTLKKVYKKVGFVI
jgi:tryptophanyl-tRNA synthetase